MPPAPQPRSRASRTRPMLSGPTKPSSLRAMTSISGPRTRWRRRCRSPSVSSRQGPAPVASAGASAGSRTGGALIRTATRSASETANSAPAAANAAGDPPNATSSPPSGPPVTVATRAARPRIPCTRASWPGAVIRGGRAPTAGRNRASTTPKTRATAISGHRPGAVRARTAATANITTQRAASLPMTTRRGPHRSASTPPPSIRTARGTAPTASTTPAWAGLPERAAAQASAM